MTSQRKAFTSKENSLRAITFIVLITKGRYDLQRIQRRRQTNRERCGPFVPKFKTTDAAASASTSAPVPGQRFFCFGFYNIISDAGCARFDLVNRSN